MEYSIRGQYIRLSAKGLCKYDNHYVGQVEITNLTVGEIEKKREWMDYIYRVMYTMYDSINAISVENRRFEAMVQGPLYGILKSLHLPEMLYFDEQMIADVMIHKDDRKAFLSFARFDTIVERIAKMNRGYLSDIFRTKNENGSYEWKMHTIQYNPDAKILIYTTKRAPISKERIIHGVIPEFEATHPNEANRIIWKGIMESKTINLFWKDTKRRFIGANQKFLDTYGFADIVELIGKTDEDMNWHMDNGPFHNDEIRVLRDGETIVNSLGKCIIKGKLCTIIASKEPVYQDGEIVGLIGTFINLDEVVDDVGILQEEMRKDPLTDLLSANGLLEILPAYVKEWEQKEEKFAMLTVSYVEYQRAVNTYGDRAAGEIIHEIGRLMQTEAQKYVVAARFSGGSFVLLTKYQDQESVNWIVNHICEQSAKVRELCGYKVTLHPQIKVYFCEDADKDMRTFLSAALLESGFEF